MIKLSLFAQCVCLQFRSSKQFSLYEMLWLQCALITNDCQWSLFSTIIMSLNSDPEWPFFIQWENVFEHIQRSLNCHNATMPTGQILFLLPSIAVQQFSRSICTQMTNAWPIVDIRPFRCRSVESTLLNSRYGWHSSLNSKVSNGRQRIEGRELNTENWKTERSSKLRDGSNSQKHPKALPEFCCLLWKH